MKKVLLKNLYLFFYIIPFVSVDAQEYKRVWGTYFGPAGTTMNGSFINEGIILDPQKNMYIRGHVWNSILYNTSYYNQFITGNGGTYTNTNENNGFSVSFTPSGIPDNFGYSIYSLTNNNTVELLLDVDNQNNKLKTYYSEISSNLSPTSGTWLQTNPQSMVKNMLTKYSAAGNLLWASYLPDSTLNANIITDPDGNIYITGKTLLQNISTPGVFQENFDIIYSQGTIKENAYLVKLNSNGQLIWATYLPSEVLSMEYYDNALYMITSTNTNILLDTMASSGSFQSVKSDFSITKMNTQNGQRSWGTYYGPASTTSLYLLYDLDVNETGLYLVGTDYNINSSHFFATPNSYKTQVTGSSDLFLTKFSHGGDRLWSTYFGGNGDEINTFDKVIDLNGDEIFISGTTAGSTDNIATPGSYQDTPQNNALNSNNSFFAKFNSAGGLEWSSYYGGSSLSTSHMKSINIKYDDNSLFLFGNTSSNVGFTTENAYMPIKNPNTTTESVGFFAKLSKKESLSVSDTNKNRDLVLYNNPNNGIFTISGSILQNEQCTMSVYDMSGKYIIKKNLDRKKNHQFDLQSYLSPGNYLIQVNNEKADKIKVFKMTVKK